MKIQFSLPTNEAFFNRYATLIPTLSKLGLIAQFISALTEVSIIYSIILSRVSEIAPSYAGLLATIGAITGTAFLEVGLRKFTPYSVRAFLYQRFKGLDLAMTIFILTVCLGLFFGSGSLSFKGSKELVKIAAPTTKLKTTDKTDAEYNQNKREAKRIFTSDSVTIANGYSKQIEAERKRFTSLIAEQQTKLTQYTQKEQRTGLSYQSRKDRVKKKVASLEVKQADQLAQLEISQANELKELTGNRRKDLQGLESVYLTDKKGIESTNTEAKEKAESSVNYYGSGLAWFTIACLLTFLFSVILEQIHKKGSGVEQVAQPNQYHFSQSVFDEFTNMANDKVNFLFRNKIENWANTTPPPPLPKAPPTLYDLSEAKQQRLLFTLADDGQRHYVLDSGMPQINAIQTKGVGKTSCDKKLTKAYIENSKKNADESQELEETILQYLKAYVDLKSCNLNDEAKQVKLKANQVIKAYLGEQATDKNVKELRYSIIGFLDGKNPNPFSHHHRKPIGFNTNKNSIKSEVKNKLLRKSYNDTLTNQNKRTCAHCSKSYIYRHHKQKYCTDNCRIEAWQKRTGKDLKMKRKK